MRQTRICCRRLAELSTCYEMKVIAHGLCPSVLGELDPSAYPGLATYLDSAHTSGFEELVLGQDHIWSMYPKGEPLHQSI